MRPVLRARDEQVLTTLVGTNWPSLEGLQRSPRPMAFTMTRRRKRKARTSLPLSRPIDPLPLATKLDFKRELECVDSELSGHCAEFRVAAGGHCD